MISRISMKVAAVSAGLVLAAAVAASAAGGPPEQADKGLSNAEERTGKDLPVRADGDATPPGDSDGEPDADEVDEAVDGTEVEDAVEPDVEDPEAKDNHGAVVSEVARNTTATGREKGEAVSTVARDNHGHSDEHGAPDDDGDDGDDLTTGNGQGKAKGHQRG